MALIAVDMTPVLPGGENGGAKIFVLELLKSFQKMAPKDKFLILTASWNHEELSFLDSTNMSRCCIVSKEQPKAGPQCGLLGLGLRKVYRRLRRRLKKHSFIGLPPLSSRGVDLLFCPFTAPRYAEPGICVVSIVYDLQHLVYPQFFSNDEIDGRNIFLDEVRCRANYIICISEQVRQSVLKYLKTDPDRTKTVHICIQSRFCEPDDEAINTDGYLLALGLTGRSYMFYPANFWPHKNHKMLLVAFGMLLSSHPEIEIDLVLTGALDKLIDELKDLAKRMGLSKRVHFLGFISNAQLSAVWKGCDFLVFPSLYEGFGIPVLEAMGFGKPVICSNTTSLPEVGGDAAIYFDPRIPSDIVNCMEQVISNKSLQNNMIERGFKRAAEFTLENMTRNYLEIFASALRSPSPFHDKISGLFEDGWTSNRLALTYSSGLEKRIFQISLEVPPFHTCRRVTLKIEDKCKILQKLKIERGNKITVRQILPQEQGHLTVSLNPVFSPAGDSRHLSCRCLGCHIVSPNGETKSLIAGEK